MDKRTGEERFFELMSELDGFVSGLFRPEDEEPAPWGELAADLTRMARLLLEAAETARQAEREEQEADPPSLILRWSRKCPP